MTLDEIKAEIKADIEQREAFLAAAPMDFQTPANIQSWRVGVTRFIITWQEDEFGYSIMLMRNGGAGWTGWGGHPDYRATIVENVSADIIDQIGAAQPIIHGREGILVRFMDFIIADAQRRAQFVAGIDFPDPADKVARAKFVINNQINVVDNVPTLPPPPLGVAPA